MTIVVLYLLAVARITRLLGRDVITQRLRDAIFVFSPPPIDTPGASDATWAHVKVSGFRKKLKLLWRSQRGDWDYVQEHVGETTPGFFGKLFSCADCLSVWVAAGLGLFYWAYPDIAYWVLLVSAGALAASASQRLIFKD